MREAERNEWLLVEIHPITPDGWLVHCEPAFNFIESWLRDTSYVNVKIYCIRRYSNELLGRLCSLSHREVSSRGL